MDQVLNESLVNTEDLNQVTKNKGYSILEQEAKGKRKQKEKYSDAHLKPFEKAYLANISKFHEKHTMMKKTKYSGVELNFGKQPVAIGITYFEIN